MPSVRRLKTADDVRRTLADLYRKLERDEIDVQKARAAVYLLATLASVIQSSDLEKRLEALEAAQDAA